VESVTVEYTEIVCGSPGVTHHIYTVHAMPSAFFDDCCVNAGFTSSSVSPLPPLADTVFQA
jgi:hypothetical protein